MRSYATARGYLSFLEILAWIVVGIGLLLALAGMGAGSQGFGFGGRSGGMAFVGAMPGLLLALLGFFGVVNVQIGRAGVDSAEYGQQALAVAREQLAISRNAAIREKGPSASSFAESVGAKTEASRSATPQKSFADRVEQQGRLPNDGQDEWRYRETLIKRVEDGFFCAGETFPSLEATKAAIDHELDTKITQEGKLYYVGGKSFLKLENARVFATEQASRKDGSDA